MESENENDLPKGIGKPATRAFENEGLVLLEQFQKVTEAEILKLHGVGPKAVRIIREALNEKGMSFAE